MSGPTTHPPTKPAKRLPAPKRTAEEVAELKARAAAEVADWPAFTPEQEEQLRMLLRTPARPIRRSA